jgi:nitrite reductase (NADH) small subunit
MDPDAQGEHVCALRELEDGRVKLVSVRRRKIALVRLGDEVFALGDACPHMGGPLSEGKVSVRRGELICPWHYFRFDVRTGASITNPQMCTPVYAARVVNGDVFVAVTAPVPS